MASSVFKLRKSHLLYAGAAAAFAMLTWAAYRIMLPPLNQQSYEASQLTSAGEELRIGLTLHEAQSQGWLSSSASANIEAQKNPPAGDAPTSAAEKKKQQHRCKQAGQLWFEAGCLKLEDFDIWLHSSKKSALVLSRTADQCSSASRQSPPATPTQWHKAASFVAPVSPGDYHAQWSAIYCLYSESGQQFLTREAQQRTMLIEKHGFKDAGVLLYVPLGKSFGNSYLRRFIPTAHSPRAKHHGPWNYHLENSLSHWHFDGTLGAVQLNGP